VAADEPPLIAGRIHGVRQWSVGWSAGSAELRGFANTEWVAGGEPTVARCRAGGGGRWGTHRPPRRDCSCGLYALHPWEQPGALYGGAGGGLLEQIHGIVEAWGQVELHGNGFRAQYARPVALALVGVPRRSDAGRIVDLLASRYYAEVIEVADVDELGERCRERGWGLSRQVVRSLVPDDVPPAPAPARRAPAPLPASSTPTATRTPAPPPSRLRRAVEIAATAVWVVLAVAWYGWWAFVAVMVVIGIISGDFGSDEEPFSAQKLRVTEQALVRFGGELSYVAVVRNMSETRVAMAAFARGKVLDRSREPVVRLGGPGGTNWRPTLLPGERGVVVDALPSGQARTVPDRLRFKTEVVARRKPAPDARPPVRLGEPSLDRARCEVRIPVDAGRAARGAGITALATDAAGEIRLAGTVRLGRAAARRGRKLLFAGEPGECPGWLQGVEAYPFLFPDQVASEPADA
jgi:hypothetical protein